MANTKQIAFRMDGDEKGALRKLAKSQGLTLASFCRFILLQQLKNNIREGHNAAAGG